jgi:hypothetical protein
MKPVRDEQGTARIIEEFGLRLCPPPKFGQRQGCSRSDLSGMCSVCTSRRGPPPPCFSQVFILKVVKVLYFDILSQVFILKVVTARPLDSSKLLIEAGPLE